MDQRSDKAPINLYSLLDNEMHRMHALLQTYMTLPRDTYYSISTGSTNQVNHGQMSQIYKRITEMQDIMLNVLKSHDALVQEKVAELALMGTEDSETKDK